MRRVVKYAVLTAAVLALLSAAVASGGCGGSSDEGGSAQWREVITTTVSGEEPVKLNLGTFELGTKARLAWNLTGPVDRQVTLTFRLINADYGTGFGYSMTPESQGFQLEDENAMTIGPIKPGNFNVYFSQRFAPEDGPGYDAEITVYTLE